MHVWHSATARAWSSGRSLVNHPLCREDCPGLCPECGIAWDELPADHSHEQVDPRWAALSGLTEDDKKKTDRSGPSASPQET